MAALRALMGLSVAAVLVHTAIGATHVVGGSSGWALGTDFGSWAALKKFRTGDSLSFSYGTSHSVLEVSKADYDSCSISSPLSSAADGSTVVKLSSPGKRYFICGTPGHCMEGMKVEVHTVDAAPATPPPAVTPPPAPSPPKRRSPPPAKSMSTVSPPPPPPKAPPSSLAPAAEEPARPKASVMDATAAPALRPSAAAAFGQTTQAAMGVAVGIVMVLAI